MIRPRPLALAALALAALTLAGCPANDLGVGDTCVPEAIPQPDGFAPNEVYLEFTSVQCRTGICMVHELDGHPSGDDEEIFCTCRCDGAPQSAPDLPLCECPSGYACEPFFNGYNGSYCVKEELLERSDAGT